MTDRTKSRIITVMKIANFLAACIMLTTLTVVGAVFYHPVTANEFGIYGEMPDYFAKMNLPVVKTVSEQAKGLSGRPDIDGMVFQFDRISRMCMWNAEVDFAVDVYFYDPTWRYLNSAHMAAKSKEPVCAKGRAAYVIELNHERTKE